MNNKIVVSLIVVLNVLQQCTKTNEETTKQDTLDFRNASNFGETHSNVRNLCEKSHPDWKKFQKQQKQFQTKLDQFQHKRIENFQTFIELVNEYKRFLEDAKRNISSSFQSISASTGKAICNDTMTTMLGKLRHSIPLTIRSILWQLPVYIKDVKTTKYLQSANTTAIGKKMSKACERKLIFVDGPNENALFRFVAVKEAKFFQIQSVKTDRYLSCRKFKTGINAFNFIYPEKLATVREDEIIDKYLTYFQITITENYQIQLKTFGGRPIYALEHISINSKCNETHLYVSNNVNVKGSVFVLERYVS